MAAPIASVQSPGMSMWSDCHRPRQSVLRTMAIRSNCRFLSRPLLDIMERRRLVASQSSVEDVRDIGVVEQDVAEVGFEHRDAGGGGGMCRV